MRTHLFGLTKVFSLFYSFRIVIKHGRVLTKGYPLFQSPIGYADEFLYGEQRDVNKAKRVSLESGDVLILGGESRHIYDGVKAIIPDTAPPALLGHIDQVASTSL